VRLPCFLVRILRADSILHKYNTYIFILFYFVSQYVNKICTDNAWFAVVISESLWTWASMTILMLVFLNRNNFSVFATWSKLCYHLLLRVRCGELRNRTRTQDPPVHATFEPSLPSLLPSSIMCDAMQRFQNCTIGHFFY
jgi:hypothetical protein